MAYTKEEQQSIVRQSSLKLLIEYSKLIDVELTIKELFKITEVICDFCATGYTPDMKLVVTAIDKHLASKKKINISI